MGIVIYRKSDNQVMMEVLQYPLHDNEIFERFIARDGYSAEEYAKVDIKEDEISQATQKEIIIQNGKITFGNDRPTPEPQTPMTPPVEMKLKEQDVIIADLQQRNSAMQDDLIAILEFIGG